MTLKTKFNDIQPFTGNQNIAVNVIVNAHNNLIDK